MKGIEDLVKIGFFAEVHGNIDYLVTVTDFLIQKEAVERVFFLGGDYRDLDEFFIFKKKQERGTEKYGDAEFLKDVSEFLAKPDEEGSENARSEYEGIFVRVPEPGAAVYRDKNVANKQFEMVGSSILLLVNDPSELGEEDLSNADVVFHGCDSKYGVRKEGKCYFVCPGHLRGKTYDESPASFGVCTLGEKEAVVSFYDVRGGLLKQEELQMDRRGKIIVRG